MKWLISFLTVLSLSISCHAVAHNVMGGVYAEGFEIEGEAGFSNGAMANPGTVVKVTDDQGHALGEVLIDEEGAFVFTAKQHITHHFEVNMGAGHILKMQLPAEELPDSPNDDLTSNSFEKVDAHSSINSPDQQASNNAQQVTNLMLEKAIAKQLKPLRREIQELKEKSGLRDILGGIGYIFGLLGLVAFLRERKQKVKS
ncbi:hypothetical protein [Psychromonas sp. GE-S-Ul-11]|uniref:hypothetical protein n=1 Tax=Psychromonas sp. GE-S-Ul-11 TaxID=3241170 RepID=UPI00390C884C